MFAPMQVDTLPEKLNLITFQRQRRRQELRCSNLRFDSSLELLENILPRCSTYDKNMYAYVWTNVRLCINICTQK